MIDRPIISTVYSFNVRIVSKLTSLEHKYYLLYLLGTFYVGKTDRTVVLILIREICVYIIIQ